MKNGFVDRLVNVGVYANDTFQGQMSELLLEKGYKYACEEAWHTDRKHDIPHKMVILCNEDRADGHPKSTTYVLQMDADCIAYLRLRKDGGVGTTAYSDSHDTAVRAINQIKEWFPVAENRKDNNVAVSFWSLGPNGPVSRRRMLTVPTWSDVEHNYAASTKADLVKLLNTDLSNTGGKLILWHGEAGTGKTTGLRALLREWSDTVNGNYITDPEVFFGSTASYMLNVILDESSDDYDDDDGLPWIGDDVPATTHHDVPVKNQWRLLIMEDTGELLAKNAKQETGQGLSRLLNVCDGLIGQGLRILVLITTNEDIGPGHEAVIRPGRCMFNTEFKPLSAEEQAEWGRINSREVRSSSGLLADLYSTGSARPARRTAGFQLPVPAR